MKRFIVISIIIAAAVMGLIGYWYYQKNSYSQDILKLEILAPDQADLADEVEYVVKYKNNGNVRLENSKLTFEYPDYSLVDENKSLRQEMNLPDIYPGQENTVSFKGRLLGKEGEMKVANATLSYQPKNLQARYESKTSQSIKIASVPINFEFDLPSKIESGKDVDFKLNYFSNVDYPLSNLTIKMEYPDGFTFTSSQPKALDKTQWDIGLLNKAEGGRLDIAGHLEGQLGEVKNFKAQIGAWQDGEFILFKEVTRGVQIAEPALYISQQINDSPKYTANPGEKLHYEIIFRNIGRDAQQNLFLTAKLEGKAFDFSTLDAPLGEVQQSDNSIIFDWRSIDKLKLLGPQEEGRVEFWISLKKTWDVSGVQDQNPTITNTVSLSQAQEEFVNKVNSTLEISQKGYYNDDVFGNTGPLPPQVGQTTTYTITFQAKNYFNSVKNVKVKATLGDGVKPTGKIFPENAGLTFDSQSKEIIWQIGDMEAGKGIANDPASIAFQIAFTPLSFQSGQIATLVKNITISGEDQWTNLTIEGTATSVDTTLPDDSSMTPAKGRVQ